MAIERLLLLDTVNGATYLAANVNSQDYRVTVQELLDFIQSSITSDAGVVQQFITQYAAPSSSGFNIVIDPLLAGENIHLILTPTTGFAAGTITLPITPGAVDKQTILVNCTQQVTTLTVNGNGATAVTGEPSSLGADDFFTLKYDLPTSTWYRIG